MEINYDEVLCAEPWTIILNGKKYKAEIPTVAQSIEFENTVKKGASLNGASMIEQLKKVILVIFKDIPGEEIDNCKVHLLSRMSQDVKTMVQQGLYPEDNNSQSKKK